MFFTLAYHLFVNMSYVYRGRVKPNMISKARNWSCNLFSSAELEPLLFGVASVILNEGQIYYNHQLILYYLGKKHTHRPT